jgi:DNA-binding transcriptional LysR family regulator
LNDFCVFRGNRWTSWARSVFWYGWWKTGSFSAVARERELSQAAVARQIAQLEDHFAVRLLHRTTRKLSLTDDGQMLVGLARPVLDGVETMEAALGKQRASPVGLVRVGMTVTASRLFSGRFPALLAEHPGLKVELVVSDRFGDMVEDRLDLAIRPGEITDASLVVRRLGTGLFVLVAAPSYIERKGRPSTPADLANHLHRPRHRTGLGRLGFYASRRPQGFQGVRRISRQ